ncbi:hypothetical protein ACWN8V_06905 [Vagococcus elongatus]|uniref:Guanylate kinase-like domain-containing protein n=1 Tax=Vagococcus elongatus TaxID=180344 RepID=A0A430AW31_9ENTE|nr:hypothetical protein [Vagococcus elongatus]RSU12263.1 hypothetical protein CBF29_06595 [Vagococcus elongatus]
MKDSIFVISGSSGSGKTSVLSMVNNIGDRIVTSTTRDKRDGEVDGIDYYFLDKDEFLSRDFVEYDTKYNNYYGTEVDEVSLKTSNGCAYVILTHQGYIDFKKCYGSRVVGIFIHTKKDDIVKMLKNRKEDNIDGRMLNYDYDLRTMVDYDYVVANSFGDMQTTIKEIERIVEIERAQ